MPEVAVGCRALAEDAVEIRINGPAPTFELRSERLLASYIGPVDPRLLDLLDIAGAVFAADSDVSRGGDARRDMGQDWRREFDFRIAVRTPEFWNRDDVRAALVTAVSFLTEDVFTFDFLQQAEPAALQEYLDFHSGTHGVFEADRVLLFSGGLDSLAGAIEALSTTDDRVVLVTHFSAQKLIPRQTRLAEALKKRFPGRVLWLPVNATLKNHRSRERTQRSRSFLFAALAFVAARLTGADRIQFFENGVVSLQLPIGSQVVGTLATRTTHPLGLRRMSELFDLVPGPGIPVENPYCLRTKTEVVTRLAAFGAAELIPESVSCSAVQTRSKLHPHCGSCSQCIDRRVALMAAGLEEHDPSEGYETDVLLGARMSDHGRTMALDWTRHVLGLAEITERDFVDGFGAELMRLVEAFPDQRPGRVVGDWLALHRRHGQAVREVLAAAVRMHAEALVAGDLPGTALLRTIVGAGAGDGLPIALLEPGRRTSAGEQARVDDDLQPDIYPLQVRMFEGGFEVLGLGAVRGPCTRVVGVLKPAHDEDRSCGVRAEDHRFLMEGEIAERLVCSKDSVRQDVRRCRGQLAEFYEAIMQEPPAEPLLIQNRPRRGYRIEPHTRFVTG